MSESVPSKNWGDVKRYDCKGGGIGSYCQGCYHMELDELGDYVEFEDYFALQAEVAYQTDMACQATVANAQLRAEVERLEASLVDSMNDAAEARACMRNVAEDLRRAGTVQFNPGSPASMDVALDKLCAGLDEAIAQLDPESIPPRPTAETTRCLVTSVDGKTFPHCANYPRCPCGGPEGWPDDGATPNGTGGR